MTGKELVLKAFACEVIPRAPWVPFVGVHAAKLLDIDAIEYFTSADSIVSGASKAIELYKADGIPVTFDLQIEAEILGCQLKWAANNPPAVVSHPLAEGKVLEELSIPQPQEGRLPIVLEATRKISNAHPETALYGLITGPFTLALHLLGTDAFIKMFTEPDELHRVMNFSAEVAKNMALYYLEAGADIIAVVDPMTSQIDPESFTQFVSPYISGLFNHIRALGGKSSFFVCGNAKQNIEVMCLCKPDNISIDENIPLNFVRDIALSHNISFGGNLKLTVALLMGSQEDAGRDALECIETGGTKGFVLAPGCDLAYATPIENLQYVAELAHDPYQRELLKLKEVSHGTYQATNIKDRFTQSKVVIDIITLDSSSCAPCQYMVEAVAHAVAEINSEIEYHEHRIKEKEGIEMMMALGVHNLPTICINGNIEYISHIPPKQELIQTILKYKPNQN
jgi:MtaA/CmuA family methyltransferase